MCGHYFEFTRGFLVCFAHTHIFLASKSIFKTNDENSKAICENYSKLRINPSC